MASEDIDRITHLWMDGKIVPFADAKLHVLTPTVFWATNVFEGMRGYWNAEEGRLLGFRLEDHFDRLGDSARMMRMALPFERARYAHYVRELIAANGFQEDVAIEQRVYVDGIGRWYETGPTSMFLAVFPLGRVQDIEAGVSCRTSTWRRISDGAMPPRIKVGSNYQNSRLAILEARLDGYQTTLFLNDRGKVSEGPGYCLFLVRKGVLTTPSVTSDILESITRATLIELGRDVLGLAVEEREVDRTELYVAEELFFAGTRMEVCPVVALDRLPVADGAPGPVTRRLQRLYFDVVRGRERQYAHWLTPLA